MTSIEEHKKKIKEHLEEIEDAINEGIEKKPVTIGFHCSACSIQLLELYLHCTNKISVGTIIKHEWFKKPTKEQKREPLAERKLPAEFSRKKEVYGIIYDIEEKRSKLLYGKSDIEQIRSVLRSFLRLKSIAIEELNKEGVKIE